MELTSEQKDALTELINIGYGRAAGVLSELTGYRITLEVPQITIHDIEVIAPMLEKILVSPIASVTQGFSGPFSGSALLLLDEPSALVMARLLSDERTVPHEFDANAKEIVTEVGNIVLNACLGAFGNLLHVQIFFSVPTLSIESVSKVFDSIGEQSVEPLRYGLMVHTRFLVRTANISGYLVIVLGIASLDRLLAELKNWEDRQLS